MLKFYHLRPNTIGENADMTYKFGRVYVYSIAIALILLLPVSVVVSLVVVISVLLPPWKLMGGKKCMVLCYGK